ncbi:HMG1/2-like protein [Cornus florida]|uniref:HMG1/2-like protein n=1 Tax=Cornus florida TaxID=4283 RepID=UPI002896D5CD|nr:HMG1/2-like protein [Cornus florida]
MKGLKTASVANKKLDGEIMKKRKADSTTKKEKASKKNSGAPKRPASAFLVFMEDFRKSFKENFPDNKSLPAVGKAGGLKWKSMTDSEKAPHIAKAAKKKAEYDKAMEEYKKSCVNGEEKPEESEKSCSDVHDEVEQEASS